MSPAGPGRGHASPPGGPAAEADASSARPLRRQRGSGAGCPDSDRRGLIGDGCERGMRGRRSRRWTRPCLGTGRASASCSALLRFVLLDTEVGVATGFRNPWTSSTRVGGLATAGVCRVVTSSSDRFHGRLYALTPTSASRTRSWPADAVTTSPKARRRRRAACARHQPSL
jgi:hypothetical protein